MEPTKYRVEVSQKAAQMLVSHAAFLAQVSFNAAKRLTASFKEAADSLEIMPQRFMAKRRAYSQKCLSLFAF